MPMTLLQEMVRQLAEGLTAHRDHPALDDGPSLISTSGRHEWLRACLDCARWAVEAVLDAEDPYAAALQARTALEGTCLTLEGNPPFGGLGAYLSMLGAITAATAPAEGLPTEEDGH